MSIVATIYSYAYASTLLLVMWVPSVTTEEWFYSQP